jgi:cell shape-determining protein MreC
LIKDGAVLQDSLEKYNSERVEKESLTEEKQRLEDQLASLKEQPIMKKLSSLNAPDDDQVLPSVAVTCTL